MNLEDFNKTFAVRRYDLSGVDNTQSMNPIGLRKSMYNQSMFKSPEPQEKPENRILHNAKDKMLNYAFNDSNAVMTGKVESVGKIFKSDAKLSTSPFKIVNVTDNDFHIRLRQDVVENWQTLFNPKLNIFNTSFTREQKFEGMEAPNGISPGGQTVSNTFALNLYKTGDNKREYDFESPEDEFVSFLKKAGDKNMEKLKAGRSGAIVKASSQTKNSQFAPPSSDTAATNARATSHPTDPDAVSQHPSL